MAFDSSSILNMLKTWVEQYGDKVCKVEDGESLLKFLLSDLGNPQKSIGEKKIDAGFDCLKVITRNYNNSRNDLSSQEKININKLNDEIFDALKSIIIRNLKEQGRLL
jgi:hypothetical protein